VFGSFVWNSKSGGSEGFVCVVFWCTARLRVLHSSMVWGGSSLSLVFLGAYSWGFFGCE
jgi:hypothetical protein